MLMIQNFSGEKKDSNQDFSWKKCNAKQIWKLFSNNHWELSGKKLLMKFMAEIWGNETCV